MKAQKTKISKIFSLLAIGLMLVIPMVSSVSVEATSGDNLRSEISQLEKEIQSNQHQVEHLEHTAATLEEAIADINAEINRLNKQIRLTNLKIKDLELQLEETRAELERQQAILDDSIRELYKNGKVSTFELIASSDSIGDFFDSQEYLGRVKSNIYEASLKVAEFEAQLEDQKEEQEKLLTQLDGQKKQQANLKATQQRLLRETRNEQARYRAYVRNLESKQKKLQKELDDWLRANQGNFVSYGRVNKGDVIGYTGNSGRSTGPHLHLEVRNSNYNPVNPIANGCQPGQTIGNCRLIAGFNIPYSNGGYTYTSAFGPRWGTMHNGIDVGSNWSAGYDINGAPIKAIGDGNIIRKEYQHCGAGNYLIIQHDNGYFSYYFHMKPDEGKNCYPY